MSYKHGIYGKIAESLGATSAALNTIPAYIGSLPVQRAVPKPSADTAFGAYVKKPILISSLREARELGLYSDNWETYTLCEVIHAHFMNGEKSVAPIILVNILDPVNTKEDVATAELVLKRTGKKYIGYFEDSLARVDGIVLTISADVKSQNIYYNGDKIAVEVELKEESNLATITATAEYDQINFDIASVEASDIQDALDSLDYCEQNTGVIPNIIVAPCFSEIPEFHALIAQKATDKIAGKWYCISLSDIPVTEDTYAKAKTWKDTNAYESKTDKVYWPALAFGDKKYHASTIGAYMMQKIDSENSDVPYVSTSNKELFCDRAIVGSDAKTLLISEAEANELNKVGITTVNVIKGGLRFWGSHMANYNYTNLADIAVEDRFDAPVRMSMYILNHLQNQYINEIDESFSRKDVDSIVNGAQTWLDSLVNDGMLLYASVSFNNESNSDESLANGDFEFDIQVTYSVIAKSITFKLQYTSAGLVALTTGGDE